MESSAILKQYMMLLDEDQRELVKGAAARFQELKGIGEKNSLGLVHSLGKLVAIKLASAERKQQRRKELARRLYGRN